VEVLFHDTPEERYSEALVLGFMAINIHRYSLNPTKVFQDFLDPRMPNDDEMQQLHSLLEDVEAFYKVSGRFSSTGNCGLLPGLLSCDFTISFCCCAEGTSGQR